MVELAQPSTSNYLGVTANLIHEKNVFVDPKIVRFNVNNTEIVLL